MDKSFLEEIIPVNEKATFGIMEDSEALEEKPEGDVEDAEKEAPKEMPEEDDGEELANTAGQMFDKMDKLVSEHIEDIRGELAGIAEEYTSADMSLMIDFIEDHGASAVNFNKLIETIILSIFSKEEE